MINAEHVIGFNKLVWLLFFITTTSSFNVIIFSCQTMFLKSLEMAAYVSHWEAITQWELGQFMGT